MEQQARYDFLTLGAGYEAGYLSSIRLTHVEMTSYKKETFEYIVLYMVSGRRHAFTTTVGTARFEEATEFFEEYSSWSEVGDLQPFVELCKQHLGLMESKDETE